jgi:ligand-binding sensor domain-containing protein
MISKKIIFIFFLTFVAGISKSQQLINPDSANAYLAIHWGLEEGISQGEVGSMIRDLNGFLWIGTSFGLNRFDGTSFKKYFADKSKKNHTITGNEIHGLIEDSLHNIWIGTNNGLSSYDLKADSFRNFRSVVPNGPITPFWATADEVFCYDPFDSQLSAYNIHSLVKRRLVRLSETDSIGYGDSDQYPIFDSCSNSVWMEKGFRFWAGGGLLQISLADGKRHEYTWPCYLNIPGHSHFSEGMRYDRKRNSIWISSPDGLMEFTLGDRKFHHIDALNSLVKLKNFYQWAGIDIDNEGRVWMGTYPRGIIIYNPHDNLFTVPFPEDSLQQRNVSLENVSLYCDKIGMVWSGFFSEKGIYQLVPFSPALTHYTIDRQVKRSYEKMVISMTEGGNDKIWMGVIPIGIEIWNPHADTLESMPVKELTRMESTWMEKNNHEFAYLVPLTVDTVNNKAWIAFNDIFEMDLKSRKYTTIFYEDNNGRRLPLNSTLSSRPYNLVPLPYKNGCLMVASFADRQAILEVSSEDPVARQILSFPIDFINQMSLFSDNDHLLFLQRANSSTNLTYSNLTGKWIPLPNAIDSIPWDRIIWNQSDLSFWIIAETRLLHYDKDFRLIKTYGEEDGLPGIRIYKLIVDKKNNIWFNTDRSIHELNTKTGTVIKLSEKDGFLPHNFSNSIFAKGKEGEIYFASEVGGFYKIEPDKLVSANSSVYLESLEINQQPAALPTGINNLRELFLRYYENKITIKTGIIDYYSRGKSNIRYKLEVNKQPSAWQYAPDYYTIRYEELPPGNYELVIQAANPSNDFAGPEKRLLIHISPAFWNTWWFRIAGLLLIIGSIYVFTRLRLQQKFRRQLERSEKEKQLSDLKQKTIELEMQALRAQMNPHFIFNSLNSINRFILQNNRTEASEFLTKFSKLVRMILQNSQASLITLESELECLNLYLAMEALRFNYHFVYKMSVAEDIDVEVLKVPPLILQPYVENAIWHGLMHKEEKGQLDIEVTEENDYIYFRIADNGIGRKQASALASKSATKHKSMGLKITADRIALMQNANGAESPITINDLSDPEGNPAGTEIIIKMPVLYD